MSLENKLSKKRTSFEKIKLFRELFTGLDNVYGTYDPVTGKMWQVKRPVTNRTFLAHLKGVQPYGVYLLTKDITRAIAADFDDPDSLPPIEFVNSSKHYGLDAYIEVSKAKGYHVWIFFNERGVNASKARLVVSHILEEIGYPETEIFPKHDYIGPDSFGNCINAPLFGKLVPEGKTVFVDLYTLNPYRDQWQFLETVNRVQESTLDQIIEINNLSAEKTNFVSPDQDSATRHLGRFSLPPCAKKMIRNGVCEYQRISCFRLAVHLKRLGLSYDVALAALKAWADKNQPKDGKQIISEREIIQQTSYAFKKDYLGYGCESAAVAPFCSPDCPIHRRKKLTDTQQKYLDKS